MVSIETVELGLIYAVADLSQVKETELQTQNTNLQESLLYRLTDLAARALRSCCPARGHLANRYAYLLDGLAGRVVGTSQNGQSGAPSLPQTSLGLDGASVQDGLYGIGAGETLDVSNLEDDWLNLWQSQGMDQGWLFGLANPT